MWASNRRGWCSQATSSPLLAWLSYLVLLSPLNLNSLQLLQGYAPHVGPWELWLLLLPYSTQWVERASCLELQEMSQSRDSSPNWGRWPCPPSSGGQAQSHCWFSSGREGNVQTGEPTQSDPLVKHWHPCRTSASPTTAPAGRGPQDPGNQACRGWVSFLGGRQLCSKCRWPPLTRGNGLYPLIQVSMDGCLWVLWPEGRVLPHV